MLYRSSSGSPYQSLRREIDRLFEDALGRGESGGRSWLPSVDVRETEKSIVLEFELPGIRAENVDLTSENGVLTVRGEKRDERKEGDAGEGRYHVVERSYGSFTRSFQLPPGVNEEEIEADFENGVLTVTVPKADTPRTRRIEIGGAKRGEVRGAGESRKLGQRGQAERGSGGDAEVRREPMSAQGGGRGSAGRGESKDQGKGSRNR